MIVETKFRAGNYKIPVKLQMEKDTIYLKFPYNKTLISEIKSMEGAKWHPEQKCWSIKNSGRNNFQLQYLQGQNPYAKYDAPLIEYTSKRPLYAHQLEMIRHALTRRYCIFACEMGTGKSLAAIEVAETLKCNTWYVGPKSGVKAFDREIKKWQSDIRPRMLTYEELVKVMQVWPGGKPPQLLIVDESSKVKTPTAQRSQAVMHLAEAIREEWGDQGCVILMSGTPAPKSPMDWWFQCEIACPGFLKEGTSAKFRMRLSLVEERESISGGVYPHHITWLDNPEKCAICGQFKDHLNHVDHVWKPSRNEVEHLYQRLKGLVLVKFKKDCLDLPEKQYRIIKLTPKSETLRAAKLIKESSARVIEALTRLRELSDGFQYTETMAGRTECKNCSGTGQAKIFDTEEIGPCDYCGGQGAIAKYERGVTEVASPKDDAFKELLDDHSDIGRFIVWGGFTATVDRLVDIAHDMGWHVLRVDGRGYVGTDPFGNPIDSDILLNCMDASHPDSKAIDKVCFVGHPQAGGMALTLTASPTELFYSNSFDGTARMQAEDRFHRAGMDTNRGATIIDLIHLPTDQLVLDNLLKKKKLQALSMGELDAVFSATTTNGIQ